VLVVPSVLDDVALMTESLPNVIPVSEVVVASGLGVADAVESVVVASEVMTEATPDRTSPIVDMMLPNPESALLEESVVVLLSPVTCLFTATG